MGDMGGMGGMGAHIDSAIPPRAGEHFDVAVLQAWLRTNVPELSSGDITVGQFPSGHSNLTYLVCVGDREVVLRRPPYGALAMGGHDMSREYRILERLHRVYPNAPRPIAFCDDAGVMGASFYLMERIKGVILRWPLPLGLDLGPEAMGRLCGAFTDNLATIHMIDWRSAGLGELSKGPGYVERQIRGWTARWMDSRIEDVPAMDEVAAWLAAEMPVDRGQVLIHNDYKFDNLVLDPEAADSVRIVGVLDWEMATIGDPVMDLGTTLAYWVEPGDPAALLAEHFGLSMLPGAMTRAQLVDRYYERTGYDVSKIGYYYAYALWKLAIIFQQIYYRYAKGHTKDDRFADMIPLVRELAEAASMAAKCPDNV